MYLVIKSRIIMDSRSLSLQLKFLSSISTRDSTAWFILNLLRYLRHRDQYKRLRYIKYSSATMPPYHISYFNRHLWHRNRSPARAVLTVDLLCMFDKTWFIPNQIQLKPGPSRHQLTITASTAAAPDTLTVLLAGCIWSMLYIFDIYKDQVKPVTSDNFFNI